MFIPSVFDAVNFDETPTERYANASNDMDVHTAQRDNAYDDDHEVEDKTTTVVNGPQELQIQTTKDADLPTQPKRRRSGWLRRLAGCILPCACSTHVSDY
jgi:hypothetical protein